jgi:hypothetical protein
VRAVPRPQHPTKAGCEVESARLTAGRMEAGVAAAAAADLRAR